FQLGTSFDALDGTFGNDFAEQARIGHKPGLQFTGAKLDEYHLTLVLHQRYCDPTWPPGPPPPKAQDAPLAATI
ncbi:phage tail protein, partial [Arsenophonus sp.]|uniref:phage tail protein n=1 Tax=Arsenophonus sp. TaxID=1872640 RepID=UPI002854AA0D